MPDKYTCPGTETLINRLGIKDQALLDLTEQNLANIRLSELSHTPLRGSFDFPRLQAIHQKLVGDLYEWAGELRTTYTQTSGTGVAHCRPEFIAVFAKEAFGGIGAENFLRDMDHGTFCSRLAHHRGELTALHPFRDGNTRSQSAFIDQLAKEAGWEISWGSLDLDAVKEARGLAISRSSTPLQELLTPAIRVIPAT